MSRTGGKKKKKNVTTPRGAEDIRTLARTDPAKAADALRRARRAESSTNVEELDELTALVAGALRRARRFDEARTLAATAAARSPAALLEEAPPSEHDRLRAAGFEATQDARLAPHEAADAGTLGSPVSPGALAREVAKAADRDVDPLLRALGTQAQHLSSATRTHLDVGLLQILQHRERIGSAEAYLEARLQEADDKAVEALLATAVHLQLDKPVRAYADRPDASPSIVTTVLRCARAHGRERLTNILIGKLAPRLRRSELDEVLRNTPALRDRALGMLSGVLADAHDALHPEICLVQLDADEPDEDVTARALTYEPAFVDSMLHTLLERLGLPPSLAARISPARKQALMDALVDPRFDPAAAKAKLLELLDLPPTLESGPSSRPRKRKKRRR